MSSRNTPRRGSENESYAHLNGSRITDGRHRVEGRDWIRWIRSGPERVVAGDRVHPIRQIERLDQPLETAVTGETEGTAHAQAQREEVASRARVPRDELGLANVKVGRRDRPIREWTSRCSLQTIDAGDDVERE